MIKKINLFLLFFSLPVLLFAQQVEISGIVITPRSEPMPDVNIRLKGSNYGTVTDIEGRFSIKHEFQKNDSLIFSHLGYQTIILPVERFLSEKNEPVTMDPGSEELEVVEVKGRKSIDRSLIKIDKKEFEYLPTTAGSVESIIKKMPGVAARNELSSQYSVRGGNYDENLVYVNGVEIYRPLIVRSGRQEGLSFLNSDMVSTINFSAGGFEARYGDKMSSVLDIKYKRPTKFAGDFDISFLGTSAHIEDQVGNGKFSYNTGFRYKTNQYLLNTLDQEGDYKPNFYDWQAFLNYKASDKLEFEFLGNYSLNKYKFIPQKRETSFGTIKDALNINIYYEGQEVDQFENYLGAFTTKYYPSNKLLMRFIASSFVTKESETYDILGEYYLNELDKAFNSETYGDSILNIGVGGFLEHARNYMTAKVHTLSHTGMWNGDLNVLRWGIKFKHEIIDDYTNEWKMVDSAGYSIPYNDSTINLYHTLNADNFIVSNRLSGYLQNTFHLPGETADWYFNGGVRFSYWSFNNEFLVSPRISVSYEPRMNRRFRHYFSAGYYYQPPFYKEMKRPDGTLNNNIKAQKSIHFVLGTEYNFMAWGRPFKYTADVYYKKMDHLIPYKINNVKVRYAGENMAKGYATGIDMKVNGEFVDGVESWASLSIMKTEEDIKGDYYYNEQGDRVEPGYYPRPTDQLVNFSLFFQDYVPSFPTYKMQLSLHYGSRLPSSPPNSDRYDIFYEMPPYRRVDIGFSKLIIGEKSADRGFLKHLKTWWIGLEIFNLLDVNNTISYQWIQTVSNQSGISGEFAVPNYLTSRRFNLKMIVKF
jgi:hypothetical protein